MTMKHTFTFEYGILRALQTIAYWEVWCYNSANPGFSYHHCSAALIIIKVRVFMKHTLSGGSIRSIKQTSRLLEVNRRKQSTSIRNVVCQLLDTD